MSKPHVHADLMMEHAKLAQETDRPWEYFQYWDNYLKIWMPVDKPIAFYCNTNYRLKPRTIRIGSVDVPEPVREPLGSEQEYYYPFISDDDGLYRSTEWWGDSYDNARLYRGLIHLDCESAEIHAKALISLTAK
ncbi:hypothetical protein [Xenorhabdus bovienii]|uniref:hypothetical protein n=1 Tax=Xenorhabdus bovienii TaxID=40576 RepID=UPI003DA3F878